MFLSRNRIGLILLGILLFSCLARIPLARIPLERDEGEYAYIAWRWNHGEIPYVHTFNQKFPLVFLIYRLILRYVGETPSAIHWALQFNVCLILLTVFALGRFILSEETGLLAAGFSAFLLSDVSVLGQSANTEIFLILPTSVGILFALYSLRRSLWAYSVLSGFFLSLAFLCKQIALLYLVFVGGVFLVKSKKRWLSLGFLIGALVPVAMVFLHFYRAGALKAFWDCTVVYNFEYVQRIDFQDYIWNLWNWLTPHLRTFWIPDALALSFVIQTGYTYYRTRQRPDFPLAFILGWLILSCIVISIGGYFRPHYFMLMMPPLSLMAAYQFANLPLKQLSNAHGRFYAILILISFQLLSMLGEWRYFGPRPAEEKSASIYQTINFGGAQTIASYIGQETALSDDVLIFGNEPEVLFLAKRKSASRYIFLYPLLVRSKSALSRQYELLHEMDIRMPKLIVTYGRSVGKELKGGPTYMDGALKGFLREHNYYIAALATYNGEYGFRLIKGDDAIKAWKEDPSWPDDPSARYEVVIWSR